MQKKEAKKNAAIERDKQQRLEARREVCMATVAVSLVFDPFRGYSIDNC